MRAKVLLISISDDLNPGPTLPLALASLKAFLEQAQIETSCLDLFFEDDRSETVKKCVKSFGPDIVGISIKYLRFDHSRTGSTPEGVAKEIVDAVKQIWSATFVLGGAGFSTAPEHFLNAINVKYGILGDGEASLLDFVKAVELGCDPQTQQVNGLIWKNEDGSIGHQKRTTNIDPSLLPLPDRSIFDQRYYDFKGILPINGVQTCRGCSKRCIMCVIGLSEGRRERTSSPEQVVEQIQKDQQFGFEGFYIADTIFNRPITHAHQICDAFISHGIKGPWSTTVTPEGLSLDLAEKMKQTGCQLLAIGADAAEPTMLKNLRKDFTVEQLVNAVENCSKVGIMSFLTLWIGGPGETIQTVEKAFDLVDSVCPDMLLVFYGIQIYAGSTLSMLAKKEGYFQDEAELMTPRYYESTSLSREDFMEWYTKRYNSFKRIILRTGERESISLNPKSANRIGPLIFGSKKGV